MKDRDPWREPNVFEQFLLNFDLIMPKMITAYFEEYREALEHPVARFLYHEAKVQAEKQSNIAKMQEITEKLDISLCAPCVSWCLDLLLSYSKR